MQLDAAPARRSKRMSSGRLREQLEMQSMIWPALIFLAIFSYIPIYGLVIAFKEYDLITGIRGTAWVGFKYFKEFFTDPNLFGVMRNTLCLNGLALLLSFPAPIIFALFLNELRIGPFKKTVQTLSYLPHFLSWIIFGGIFMELLAPNGAINAILTGIGLLGEPINFMAHGEYFYIIFTIISMIKGLGYNSILFVAAISGVDQELYEAADMDGCSRLQKMWYVTLPSILGTVVIMLIFKISSILDTGFEQVLIFQNSLNIAYTETLDTYVYKIGMEQFRFSYATAVGLFKSIVAVLLLITANTVSKKITEKSLF